MHQVLLFFVFFIVQPDNQPPNEASSISLWNFLDHVICHRFSNRFKFPKKLKLGIPLSPYLKHERTLRVISLLKLVTLLFSILPSAYHIYVCFKFPDDYFSSWNPWNRQVERSKEACTHITYLSFIILHMHV